MILQIRSPMDGVTFVIRRWALFLNRNLLVSQPITPLQKLRCLLPTKILDVTKLRGIPAMNFELATHFTPHGQHYMFLEAHEDP